jgi:hypothetical protein
MEEVKCSRTTTTVSAVMGSISSSAFFPLPEGIMGRRRMGFHGAPLTAAASSSSSPSSLATV